ncbi:MAG: LamG-like jellyroll fold domain-containing protein [Chthoniobacteraceae bacterium]
MNPTIFRHPSSFLLQRLALALALLAMLALPVRAEFKAGAAAVDITPVKLPVLVNGGMLSRSVDKIKTRIHARAIAMSDGKEQLVIVVADSCMMTRPLLDEAKALAEKRTGIPANRMLISATHAHSVPASMGCLGTDPDPAYVPFLRDKLVEAITAAQAALEPARIGFAKADAGAFTALRRWIRRPDRIAEDPFGNKTVRANMHAGRNWDDVTGESGPKDPDLSLISIQSRDGRPLAVLANFSMHYFGDQNISADYFGLFSEGLKQRLAPESAPGKPAFVGIMSHGCSGDIYRVDYKIPEKDRPKPTIDEYTNGLLDIATVAYKGIRYRNDADLAMAERRMTLNYRVPDKQRLEWAQRIVAEMGDRLPKTPTEVYAREQIILHERQKTEIVVQALRIGDIGIATSPCETYAVTGLKIKAASPLPHTIVIELANGGDGYIPPPEQHLFGGYNTWAARSAGLEVTAEPKIAETAIELLEKVAGKQRREWKLTDGIAARAILDAKPVAYWRLNEFTGPHASDASGRGHDALYEREITFYLDGPRPAEFCTNGEINRAPHFVGGRLRSQIGGISDHYSVSVWLWNGMPDDGRDVSGWFFSRDRDYSLGENGEHLGIGGKSGNTGRLIFLHGDDLRTASAGKTVIPRWQWQHVVFVRDGETVRVYLNGQIEIEAKVAANFPANFDQCFFGGRSDNDSNWEGRLDEIAVFDRALSADEVAKLNVK